MKKEQIREKILDLVGLYQVAEEAELKPLVPGEIHIPPSGKVINESEKKNMVEAALDGWLTAGRFNEAFEKRLAKFIGCEYVLTVNSGSSANLVAFAALTSPKLGSRAIMPGDEVISVAAGFPTTINPIIQMGAIPVFVDIEIPTYNIDINKIKKAITGKTKAIMLAHTLGNPFNLEAIRKICDEHKLWMVEDCCDALGSMYKDKMVGTFGDIATLSFYPAHHITMGEGGAVFTNSLELKVIAESIRDWGRDCYCGPGCDNTCGKRFSWKMGDLPIGYDHKYIYSHLGYNLKITDMQAACGLAQLDKLGSFIDQRRKNFETLKDLLSDCEEAIILPERTAHSNPSWFGFMVTLRDTAGCTRNEMVQYLNQNNIGTRLLFSGNVTKQPYMHGRNYRVSDDLKNTDLVMNNSFWVGIQPALKLEELQYVAEKIKNYLGFGF